MRLVKLYSGMELLERCIRFYRPIVVFGLFSGGDDSLTSTDIASKHPEFTCAATMDTGTAIPETLEFIKRTCRERKWKHRMKSAAEAGQDYEQLVCEYGFPGPAMHYKMYQRLKERPLRMLVREAKQGWVVSLPWEIQASTTARALKNKAKVLLVTGVRSQESERRMGYVRPVQVEGSIVWCAVIHDWSKRDCLDYIEANGIERSPVAQLIHRSGECNCGSFAQPDEAKEVRYWYPKFGEWIDRLQEKVRAAGKPCRWGERPPGTGKLTKKQREKMMMCQGCVLREGA